ncbi:MAG: amino acid permease [Verrucomicrobia bacterium]|nr:amino acid permease [Verrucomicrobiota bacterium]
MALLPKLLRTKQIDHLQHEAKQETGFVKALGPWQLIFLGIGAIIGTGIFVLTGTTAAQHTGPALVLSFTISGIGCLFAGLCYAEYAAMIPTAGSAYTYAYATLGEFFAWIIGWDLILEYLFASATVAVGWSGYAVKFLHNFGLNVPPALCSSPLVFHQGQWSQSGALFNLPAVLVCLAVTALLVIGIRESTNFNNAIVIIKLSVIVLFILCGSAYINTHNWVPFIPENTGHFGEYGWSGILAGAGVIFFAYIGFDAVSTAAQESRNPQRDMPKGILGSLLICTVLYILVSLVLTGIVPFRELAVPAPVALAIDRTGEGLRWLGPLVQLGAIAGLSSVILVMMMGQPRIFFSMAKDGLLPKGFAKLHPKFGTPHITTVITGVMAALMAGVLPIGVLGELVSIGTLLAFTIVCLSILVLRKTRPGIDRPFRCPGLPWVPLAGAFVCLAQMFALPLDTWLRLVVWLALGLAIYFFYGIRHSRLNPVKLKP